jgi:hypothetical protein
MAIEIQILILRYQKDEYDRSDELMKLLLQKISSPNVSALYRVGFIFDSSSIRKLIISYILLLAILPKNME